MLPSHPIKQGSSAPPIGTPRSDILHQGGRSVQVEITFARVGGCSDRSFPAQGFVRSNSKESCAYEELPPLTSRSGRLRKRDCSPEKGRTNIHKADVVKGFDRHPQEHRRISGDSVLTLFPSAQYTRGRHRLARTPHQTVLHIHVEPNEFLPRYIVGMAPYCLPPPRSLSQSNR